MEASASCASARQTRTAAVPFGASDPDDKSDSDVWPTLWFTLADLGNPIYYFQATTSPNLYWVILAELPLAEGQPVREIDAYDPQLTGNISRRLSEAP